MQKIYKALIGDQTVYKIIDESDFISYISIDDNSTPKKITFLSNDNGRFTGYDFIEQDKSIFSDYSPWVKRVLHGKFKI